MLVFQPHAYSEKFIVKVCTSVLATGASPTDCRNWKRHTNTNEVIKVIAAAQCLTRTIYIFADFFSLMFCRPSMKDVRITQGVIAKHCNRVGNGMTKVPVQRCSITTSKSIHSATEYRRSWLAHIILNVTSVCNVNVVSQTSWNCWSGVHPIYLVQGIFFARVCYL